MSVIELDEERSFEGTVDYRNSNKPAKGVVVACCFGRMLLL